MAFLAGTFLQVLTGGSDTANGGGFDTSNTHFATDGSATVANTSAPVFSSASYNFAAGDVGARLYIASGTGWLPGWYTIASVASNKATLTASVGTATLSTGFLNTAVGCATTASPSSATWGVDYSQMNSPRYSFTDMIVAVTTTNFTSVLNPVNVAMVGNLISVTSGGTVQRVEVVSVSGTTATCDKALGTVAAVAHGGLGGALASPGQAAAIDVSNATTGVCIVVGPGTYTLTSSSSAVSGGLLNSSVASTVVFPWKWEGYSSVQGDGRQQPPTGTPTISAGALTSIVMMTLATTQNAGNFTLDGNSKATTSGLSVTQGAAYRFNVKNCTNSPILIGAQGYVSRSSAFSNTGPIAIGLTGAGGILIDSESYNNTSVGIQSSGAGSSIINCISANNTSNNGIVTSAKTLVRGCVSYGNGSSGFSDQSALPAPGSWENCISEANGAFAYQASALNTGRTIFNCAAYNNTSGVLSNIQYTENLIVGTVGTFLNNAGSGDFSLNNLAGQGALLRAAGYPGLMPRGTSTGYVDIGAVQSSDLNVILPIVRERFRYIERTRPQPTKPRYVPLQPTTFSSVPIRTPNKQVRTLVSAKVINRVPVQVQVPLPLRTPAKQVRTIQKTTQVRHVPIQPTTFSPIPIRVPNRQIRVLVATNKIKPILIPIPVPYQVVVPVKGRVTQVRSRELVTRYKQLINTTVKVTTPVIVTSPRKVR